MPRRGPPPFRSVGAARSVGASCLCTRQPRRPRPWTPADPGPWDGQGRKPGARGSVGHAGAEEGPRGASQAAGSWRLAWCSPRPPQSLGHSRRQLIGTATARPDQGQQPTLGCWDSQLPRGGPASGEWEPSPRVEQPRPRRENVGQKVKRDCSSYAFSRPPKPKPNQKGNCVR